MRKAVIIIVFVVVAAKLGVDYLTSDRFQEYGDRTKATWTCEANRILGQFMMMVSHYKQAAYYFSKIAERCPDTLVSEEAEFEYARALESQGLRRDAVDQYEAYAAKYPGTRRGRLAAKSAGILRTS